MNPASPTGDPVELTLLLAPDDDEPDADDSDGGLTEARRERDRGEGISTEELRRELELG
jgi:hypothetical protein